MSADIDLDLADRNQLLKLIHAASDEQKFETCIGEALGYSPDL